MEVHDKAVGADVGVLDRTRHAIPALEWVGADYAVAPVERERAPTLSLIDFQMEVQERRFWCWAAVAVSIDRFYPGPHGVTQCDLASLVLGVPCSQPRSNRPSRLEPALATVGRHHEPTKDAWATAEEITREISAGRVLAALIQWRGGGGHFVAISGVQATPQGALVRVNDPRHGSSHSLPIGQLRSGYKGSGDWVATYFTES